MRCCTTKSALARIARLMAICKATSRGPVRLRRSVEKIGRNSMVTSLRLELQGGGDLAGTPGGEQARDDRGADGDGERGGEHRPVHVRDGREVLRRLANQPQAAEGEQQAEQAAGQPDDRRLGEELAEDRAL